MPNHLVEGRPLPNAVAGHVALELCNTKALWGHPDEKEYLTDFTSLALWAREHELLTEPAELTPRQQSAVLGQVRRLRWALYAAITADASLAPVHAFVVRAVTRASYGPSGLEAPPGPSVVVDRLALAAHALLSDHGLASVSRCSASRCGWVFLDPTGRRRWCIMAVCGNRAKARRHAARKRIRPPRPSVHAG